METLEYIVDKYGLELSRKGPTEIPDLGRDDLPGLFRELGYTVGAEIGVEAGLYAEILCRGLPELHLSCVDAWQAYRGYRDHVDQAEMDQLYGAARNRLRPYQCTLIRAFSMEAVRVFEDDSLDFVYIDGNHEIPPVLDDICAWRKKVRPGGIVAGHDYYESTRKDTKNHAKYAVDCVVRSFRIRPWFLVGLKAKLPGMTRDVSRSWFWVKE